MWWRQTWHVSVSEFVRDVTSRCAQSCTRSESRVTAVVGATSSEGFLVDKTSDHRRRSGNEMSLVSRFGVAFQSMNRSRFLLVRVASRSCLLWCLASHGVMSHWRALLPHAVNCGRFCFWRRQTVIFCLCVKYLGNHCQIRTEDVFGPSLGRVWRSRSKSPGTKTAFSALSAACVRFMFGKTSLTSSSLSVLQTCGRSQNYWRSRLTVFTACGFGRMSTELP